MYQQFQNLQLHEDELIDKKMKQLIAANDSLRLDAKKDLVPPQFPKGEKGLLSWLNRHIQYPEEAVKNGIQGTVKVFFVVSESGNIKDISLLNNVNPLLDVEALRVCRMLPNFTPATLNDHPVEAWYVLPINFALPLQLDFLSLYSVDDFK